MNECTATCDNSARNCYVGRNQVDGAAFITPGVTGVDLAEQKNFDSLYTSAGENL